MLLLSKYMYGITLQIPPSYGMSLMGVTNATHFQMHVCYHTADTHKLLHRLDTSYNGDKYVICQSQNHLVVEKNVFSDGDECNENTH